MEALILTPGDEGGILLATITDARSQSSKFSK
jgi:hypothetical protein